MKRFRLINKKIYPFSLYLFLIALFFFKIPSFYLFPFIHNAFLTSQSFSRILFLLIFSFSILYLYINENKNTYKGNIKTVLFLITVLFFSQSLTILSAINIFAFLSRYKDIIAGYISFFLFYFYGKEGKKIISILLLSALVNSLYQGLMLISKEAYLAFANFFIYEKQFELSLINLERGRLFLDAFDETLLPFMIVNYKEKHLQNINFILFILVSFFSFVSNWRIRILMLSIALFSSLIFLLKKTKRITITYVVTFLLIGFFINFFLQYTVGFSFFDRFILQNKARDLNTLSFRGEQIREGINIGETSFWGVGLGNYYDSISQSKKKFRYAITFLDSENIYANEYIHNIFILMLAESGLIGLVILLFLLTIFIRKDLAILKSGDSQKKAIVISSWTLFTYSLFNPPIPGAYQILFWGFRGFLLK